MTTHTHSAVRLTTDSVPLRDRVAVAREVFGRLMFNLELEPDPDQPLDFDFQLRSLSGLHIVTGTAGGVISRRTKAQLADSNDDLFLSLNESDLFTTTHRGMTTDMGPGDAVLATCAETMSFQRKYGRATGLRVPRLALAHIAPTVEDLTGRLISHHNEPLRLLRGYINSLHNETLDGPLFQHLTVTHVHDLLALALGADRDVRAQAAGRGLKAAQLREIKTHILSHLGRADLSVITVAAAHRLTPRYVQRLFETDGQTLSDFIIAQRLARAWRIVRDPRHQGRAVSAIAFECGFGSASHFNRMFRRAYGVSPSDIRAEGAGSAPESE